MAQALAVAQALGMESRLGTEAALPVALGVSAQGLQQEAAVERAAVHKNCRSGQVERHWLLVDASRWPLAPVALSTLEATLLVGPV